MSRGLLERGRASLDGTPPGAMATIVLYDLALETAAKTVRAAFPPSTSPGVGYATKPAEWRKTTRDPSLPMVLDQILASRREIARDDTATIASLDGARRLREFRNLVQHDGNVPSPDELNRSWLRATDFIEEVLSVFFDRRLAELSRASLVADPEVRERITLAEKEASTDDFSSAVGQLAIAFELARYIFRTGEPARRRLRTSRSEIERALGHRPGRSRPFSSFTENKVRDALRAASGNKLSSGEASKVVQAIGASGELPKELPKFLVELTQAIERIDDRLEALSVAGDPSEYAWFRQRVPRPSAYWGDERLEFTSIPPDPPADQADFLRAMDFVTATALRWEQEPVEPQEEVDTPSPAGQSEEE